MTACKLMLCLASALALVTGCDDGQPSADAVPAGEVPTQQPGNTPLHDAGLQGHTADPAITPSHDASSAPYDAAAMRDTGQPVVDAAPQEAGAGDAAAADAAVPGNPAACDRKCLAGDLDAYLKALIAHDPMQAKFAASVRVTENGREAKLGEGLWKSAMSVREDTRFYFIDPQEGQAAVHVVLLETASAPVIYQARIKVVRGEIAELESVAVRKQGAANGFFSPDGMVPQAAFKAPIAPEKRLKREALRSAVDVYLNFLEGKRENLNFDANCARYENGVRTATGSNIASQRWSFDVQPRYLVFDEEEGLVWGMFPFSAADTALVVGEVFKVVEGKLMMIQAVMANMPAKAWP